jgi:hypothetical protein
MSSFVNQLFLTVITAGTWLNKNKYLVWKIEGKAANLFKVIVLPFKLGDETRLFRSTVITGGPASFLNNFNDTISREEQKTMYCVLMISEMALSNQSDL